ncbi:MAG: hypothetical protein BalsKO_03790 [Balneolaceae bacterium]
MKRITILLILFTFSITAQAQTLRVTSSTSEIMHLSASITSNSVLIAEGNGSELVRGNYSAPVSDPSLETYVFPDGSFIVRENIANFLVYDSFGQVKKSISNSTQSEGGEAISELAADQFGKTVVLYNPKVIMNGVTGSRAKIINSKKTPLDIYYSQDRELSLVEVSSNGEFVAFISVKAGSDDEVQLMDRFGNELKKLAFDQPVKGASFSENGLFVTIYSGSRAAAYEVRSGERVGSTSFRNTSVIFASYDPIDKTIVGLSGSGSSTISDIQLHAVNVAARKIARENMDGSLEVVGQIKMQRIGSGRYTILGLDNELSLRADF